MGAMTRFIELKNKMAINPKGKGLVKHRDKSAHISNYTVQNVSGTYDGDTSYVKSCYFQDENDPLQQSVANILNNDDPVPGAWNASDFQPPLQSGHTYDLYAVPNDNEAPDIVYGIHVD